MLFHLHTENKLSIHKITKYLKHAFGGPLLKKELKAINSVIQSKKGPITCIIGGSKISTKNKCNF